MDNIKVLKCENKQTVNGKPYKALEVEVANEVRKVSMWSFFPDFANIKEGSVFMGKMTKGEKYWDLTYEGAEKPRGGQSGAFKQKVIEETMQRKEGSIAKFQDNKELSIKIASTMNKAVELAIAEIKDIRTMNTLEADILKWREWLWKHWDVKDTEYPPF